MTNIGPHTFSQTKYSFITLQHTRNKIKKNVSFFNSFEVSQIVDELALNNVHRRIFTVCGGYPI